MRSRLKIKNKVKLINDPTHNMCWDKRTIKNVFSFSECFIFSSTVDIIMRCKINQVRIKGNNLKNKLFQCERKEPNIM
jgi:hypothetical protein